ncbi:MAG TPA: ATP-binding cassette domain-containing protein [Pseudonocardiaceae bacterium]
MAADTRTSHPGDVPHAAPAPPTVGITTEVVFRCRNLSYTYLNRFPALRDVSLDVLGGEKLPPLGANGCGKSTLLKVLDGLVFPTVGTVHAFGEQVTEDALEDVQFSAGFGSRVAGRVRVPELRCPGVLPDRARGSPSAASSWG